MTTVSVRVLLKCPKNSKEKEQEVGSSASQAKYSFIRVQHVSVLPVEDIDDGDVQMMDVLLPKSGLNWSMRGAPYTSTFCSLSLWRVEIGSSFVEPVTDRDSTELRAICVGISEMKKHCYCTRQSMK